jgi:type I restriction enzyme S subunit
VPEKGRLRADDVLVNSTGLGTLGRVSCVRGVESQLPTFADTHVTIVRPDPRRAVGAFLAYSLRRPAFIGLAEEVLAVGATKQRELSARALARHRIWVPDLRRQREIVDYLDRESARIAAAQRRLRDLAARALDPAMALAARAWAEHPLGKIGYAFEVQLGKKLYESRIEHSTAKPYLRNANVHWDRFALDDVKVMNFEGPEIQMYALRPGDLLVCEGGEPGRCAVWEGRIDPCFFQMALNRVRPHGLGSTRWVMWALRSLARTRGFGNDGPGRYLHLTAEQLRATRIPLPDPETQHRLVAEIDAEAARAKRLTELSRALDERLDEYRGALITSAVKGEIEPRRMTDSEMDERLAEATEDALR